MGILHDSTIKNVEQISQPFIKWWKNVDSIWFNHQMRGIAMENEDFAVKSEVVAIRNGDFTIKSMDSTIRNWWLKKKRWLNAVERNSISIQNWEFIFLRLLYGVETRMTCSYIGTGLKPATGKKIPWSGAELNAFCFFLPRWTIWIEHNWTTLVFCTVWCVLQLI